VSIDFGNTDIQDIDEAIQEGRGAAASVVGQTADVRRLTNSTNVSILNNAPVLLRFPFIPRRATKGEIENETFGLEVWTATCDNTLLMPGDVVTQTSGSFENDGSQWIFAQRRPMKHSLFVRAESNITISRPTPTGGSASTQPPPGSGAVFTPGTYGGIWTATDKQLVLINGMYAFTATPGTLASVPCGIQQTSKVKPPAYGNAPDAGLNIPTALPITQYVAYLPLIPGDAIQELDRLHFGASDSYEVMSFFTTEQTGFTGYICFVHKLATP
jgi:hypothetical protein